MSNDNPKLIFAVIFGLLMLARGCGETVPQPDNATVAQCFDAYQALMADAWEQGAAKLESGELQDGEAAYEFIARETDLARQAAFAPIYERQSAAYGGDNYSTDANAKCWREFAMEAK